MVPDIFNALALYSHHLYMETRHLENLSIRDCFVFVKANGVTEINRKRVK